MHPRTGFEMLKRTGFSCADFSLNSYLLNTSLYNFELNNFFDRTVSELEDFFRPHKEGAACAGINIGQMARKLKIMENEKYTIYLSGRRSLMII